MTDHTKVISCNLVNGSASVEDKHKACSKSFKTYPASAIVVTSSCCSNLTASSTPSWPLYLDHISKEFGDDGTSLLLTPK